MAQTLLYVVLRKLEEDDVTRWTQFVLLLVVFCMTAHGVSAQENGPGDEAPESETVAPESRDTVVITATRLSDDPDDQPYAFHHHDRESLDRAIGRTALDRLNYSPGIFIQHTAPNQTSPFVRGLTGEQSLLLIDGVRLSHAFMRPGPNQYAAMVPDMSVDAVDVILGSTSVVNGSDGHTGALDFRLAEAGRGVDSEFSPFLKAQVDAANGSMFQGGFDGNTRNWSYSVEFDVRDFHDRVGGKDYEDHVFGGVTSSSDEIPNTAYDQTGMAFRAAYFGWMNHELSLSYGLTRQTDSPRPDGYFENTNRADRISRYFDPMEFQYVHLRDRWEIHDPLIESLQTTVWWHYWNEEAVRERIRNQGTATEQYRLEEKQDELNAIGVDLQFESFAGARQEHQITWGVTYITERTDNKYEEYRSPAGSLDPAAATPNNPANWSNNTTVTDGSSYQSFGLFAQDSWDINKEFNLLFGARYSNYRWKFDDVTGDTDDFTGSLRGLWHAHPTTDVFAGLSKGFRAPNLTNLDGAVDRGSSGQNTTGNPDLDPEVSYTFEAGIRSHIGPHWFTLAGFFTRIDKFIQADNSGTGDTDNVEDAELQGGEASWEIDLSRLADLGKGYRLSVPGSISVVEGTKDVPQPGGGAEEDNISRATRTYGTLGLKYETPENWWLQGQVRWAEAYDDVATDPSDSDAGDARLTVAGSADGSMPGFGVLDLSGGWVGEGSLQEVTIFLENLFDKTYREVGSSVDGAGRNLGLRVTIRF